MAIQNDNTFLSKGDLKTYHEKILPYLGGNFMMSTNNSDYYSTDEKVIGVWIDGRPLYQKTYTGTMSGSYDSEKNLIPASSMPANIDPKIAWVETGSSFIEYPGGNYGSRPAVFCYSTSHMVSIWYASNTTGITMKTTGIGSIFNGGKYYVTLRYTKTTDTASTALTTPGAYDINFPNTWPENKEIYFGNGVYGYRATGNFTATAANTRWYANLISATPTANILGTGGNFHVMNNGNNQMLSAFTTPTGSTGNVLAYSGWFYNFTSSTIRFAVTTGDSITLSADNTYDVWMTYTK